MSAFLLYHRKTRPTGRLLAQVLGIPGGIEVRGTPSVVIRWGNQQGRYLAFNTAPSMAKASDKLAAFRAFEEAGVRIPTFTTEQPDRDSGTWLARSRHGFGGRDIIVQPRGMITHGFAEAEFWTEYVPNNREYRIHVFDGRVIRCQGKYLDYPEQRTSEYIKNYANGYRFRTPALRLHSDRLDNATKAVEALGLTWGAVDLVIGAHDNLAYVLEVNTAPKLAPLTMRQYSEAIQAYLRDEYDVTITPNFDVLEGRNGDE